VIFEFVVALELELAPPNAKEVGLGLGLGFFSKKPVLFLAGAFAPSLAFICALVSTALSFGFCLLKTNSFASRKSEVATSAIPTSLIQFFIIFISLGFSYRCSPIPRGLRQTFFLNF